MTPEDLEMRNAARISHLLGGQRFVRLQRYKNRPMLAGRGGNCQFVVLLDGVRLTGMLEEAYTVEGQREIERLGGGQQGLDRFMAVRQSIDDVVIATSAQAIEAYASVAAAPAELQSLAGSDACGLMAIWTGRR